ncbi:MAG TPA: pyruvate kinase [Terriglobales bacterium]|nr:pyruvate kinase [Terriglobales bacterium]
MALRRHKTKIVATIGPASSGPDTLARLIRAGMTIARLNFSHGDLDSHRRTIAELRAAEQATGMRLAIMADLPGPKIRIGTIEPDPAELRIGEEVVLTTKEISGTPHRFSVTLERLAEIVQYGTRIFLNDGTVELEVSDVRNGEVHCVVAAGGEIRSRKGINLPGVDLGTSAFTERDRICLDFALRHGVDAVSQSFVQDAADIEAVRTAAAASGRQPFVIAKIERARAMTYFDEILAAADGVMIARGDLGVEVPIESIAVTQKRLIAKCNLAGKPVITATQMLESMVHSRLPTRAEATDVANAILDGTDAVMLSAESATGRYPVEAVSMLAKIAAATELSRPVPRLAELRRSGGAAAPAPSAPEAIAGLVEHALEAIPCAAVFVPTLTGSTARMIARLKPAVWTVAFSPHRAVCQALQFSYGVYPVEHETEPDRWREITAATMEQFDLTGNVAMWVAGPSERHPDANDRIELLRIK